MRGSDHIIGCAGLTKQFRIPQSSHSTLKERVLHPLRRTTWLEYQAVNDVSFDVARGEFFGIIGRNGSGKSTLLKLLAGIYRPDSGAVYVDGTMSTFIELGVGFNMDLSGRDNLYINGTLLGLSRKELRLRYDEIVEFAELEDFMDLRMRNYSSGMQVRLAFSIALQSDPDILLTDEVLAVGDVRFQEKCYDIFTERRRKGRTIVFVSHDMSAVRQFCDRVLLMDNGVPMGVGSATDMTRRYLQLNTVDRKRIETAIVTEDEPTDATRTCKLIRVWGSDEHDAETVNFANGTAINLNIEIEGLRDAEDGVVGISIEDGNGQHIVMTNTLLEGTRLGMLRKGERVVCTFAVDNFLSSGAYSVTVGLCSEVDGATGPVFELSSRAWHFNSTGGHGTMGVIEPPVGVRVKRQHPLGS